MFKRFINWPGWKYVFISCAWLISLGGIIVLMSFIEFKKSGAVCKDVKIYMPGNQYFIDKEEVANILHMSSTQLVGKHLEAINLHELERKLNANPFIEMARVYADMDGIISIEITQRVPVLRVIDKDEQEFYVDQHGLKIPMSDNFTAKVIAASGEINEPFGQRVDTIHTALVKDIYKTAQFINRDSLWSAQIAQIYVNQKQEIELIPRVGNQRILLGNADSLETKFANLKIFYKKALPMVGWDAYKIINIKYANQVVGIKNENMKRDSAKAASDTSRIKTDTTLIKH